MVAWFTLTNPAALQPLTDHQVGIVTEATLQLNGQVLFR